MHLIDPNLLRANAEALLATKQEPRPNEALLFELQVHQVELEMQGEELRRSHVELETSRDQYIDLYDYAPVGYLTLTHKGLIDKINLTAANMLRMDRCELLNRHFAAMVASKYSDNWHLFFVGVMKHQQQNIELMLRRSDGTEFYVQLDCLCIKPADQEPMLRIVLTDITELKQELLRVLNNKQMLSESQRIAHIGSWSLELATGCMAWSNETYRIYGVSPETFKLTLKTFLALIHPDDLVSMNKWISDCHAGKEPSALDFRIVLPDSTVRFICGSGGLQYDDMKRPIFMVGSAQDITERKMAENSLYIAAIAFESQEGMMVTDAMGLILRVNKAFSTITGYSSEEVVGKNPRMFQSERQDADFYAAMWTSINNNGVWLGEIWNRRKNGERYPERLTITAVKNANGIVTNYVGTLTDITLSQEAANEIKYLAFYDPLTGLPNRRLLQDRLKSALASSNRRGRKGALLFIDMDNFKTLNDSLGHDMGDLLLRQVAQRLELCVREGDTVARLGGDEFVVMLEDLSEQPLEAATQTEVIGNKILAVLNQPYLLATHYYHCTSSIGAILFKDHDQSIDELLKQADIAMYQAKAAGRNTLRFFDPQMQISIDTHVALEESLRLALTENQFILYYQPQVFHNRQIIGAEVLIRWQHPLNGFISPANFIPLAEETGLILPIGQWVLETACAQLKLWEGNSRTQHLQLAVNVSARQFFQADFVAQVNQTLRRSAINPTRLKLELTESLVLDSIDDTIHKMQALREIGVSFSMDDFGTGYSSLSSLKKLPLNQLKIDQSFVRDLTIDPDDAVIVQTIIAMARSLGMEVIAEGVETEAQRTFLEQHDCPLYQGYLFSKPVPIEQFEALLK